MALTKKQKEFIEARALQKKSIPSLVDSLKMTEIELSEWEMQFIDEIIDLRFKTYDKLVEKYELSNFSQFEYLAELYLKLKNELNKRDFSGLPTDKLYYILDDVSARLESISEDELSFRDFDDEDLYDELDEAEL